MRYIKPEQFKGQPEEVQKVLLDWWQPMMGDLSYSKKYGMAALTSDSIRRLSEDDSGILKERNTPLFTLQQLWEFIEDKVNCFVTVDYIADEYWVNTDDWWNEKEQCFAGEDKLQAFWKCACEVARVIK